MSVRTFEELSDRLAEDLVWRKKELTVLRKLVSQATPDRKTVLLRSLIAILYAHWEGFVKRASGAYLEYLARRRLPYAELASNFVAYSLAPQIRDASSRRDLAALIEVVSTLRGGLSGRSRIPFKDGIEAGANLSSKVLRRLTTTLGIDYRPFETKAVLIDERLLGNRNRIAHGDYLVLDEDDALELLREIQALMDSYRDQIENAVAMKAYRNSA